MKLVVVQDTEDFQYCKNISIKIEQNKMILIVINVHIFGHASPSNTP